MCMFNAVMHAERDEAIAMHLEELSKDDVPG